MEPSNYHYVAFIYSNALLNLIFLAGKKARTFDLDKMFEQTRRTAQETSKRSSKVDSGDDDDNTDAEKDDPRKKAGNKSKQNDNDDDDDDEMIGEFVLC